MVLRRESIRRALHRAHRLQKNDLRGRDVPHCPLRLRGRPGLIYSLQWFEHFAASVLPGLQYCGLVYEGNAVESCKTLPAGGVDVLDSPVYWLFPNGETQCCSARSLHIDRRHIGIQADSKEDYEAIGAALGFHFLEAVATSRICWQTSGRCESRSGQHCNGSCRVLQWMRVGGLPTLRCRTLAHR